MISVRSASPVSSSTVEQLVGPRADRGAVEPAEPAQVAEQLAAR